MKKCGICGYEGKPVMITKGSLGLEIALWILGFLTCGIFVVFGALPYSIWRLCSKYRGCPNCKNPHMFKKLDDEDGEDDEESEEDFW